MKTIFIKSGAYYETPAISVAGAIADSMPFQVNQFNKSDQSFKLDFFDGQYRLYLCNHIPGATNQYRALDVAKFIEFIEKYEFAYFGLVVNNRTVLSQGDIFNKMTFVGIDKTSGKFVDCITGMEFEGDNVIPVVYGLQITKETYALFLSHAAKIDTALTDETGEHRVIDDITTVCVNDGQAIRDHFVNVKFTGVRKHFKNNDLVTGYAVYVERKAAVELDLFTTHPYVSEEFKNKFEIIVDASFPVEIKDNKVLFTAPDRTGSHYLSVTLKALPLYADVSSREIKETLALDFMVSIL